MLTSILTRKHFFYFREKGAEDFMPSHKTDINVGIKFSADTS